MELPIIEQIALEVKDKTFEMIEEETGVSFERLIQLAVADQEGRCVVLPAKLGDVVYCISERLDETTGKRYKSVSQKKVTFTQSLPDLVECEGFVYTFDEFGKTVFRDKEAAQAALERMKSNG